MNPLSPMDAIQSPPPIPSEDGEHAWYGNIQYLLNISAVGALCCVFIFLFVKLRSDHRMPGPTGLIAKLLAVWHATGREIARHCGADAAQFLLIEGGSCTVLLSIAVLAIFLVLPLNLYAGTAAIADKFSKTTINHIEQIVQIFILLLPVAGWDFTSTFFLSSCFLAAMGAMIKPQFADVQG